MRHIALFSALVASALASGCHHSSHSDDVVLHDNPVSIEIEVYDPVTNFVWENVSVRIIEVEHEWSNSTRPNPTQNDYYFTDRNGIVYFSPEHLGDSGLGFLIDDLHRAVLSPDIFEDEAAVLVEISAPGLGSVFEWVELTWDESRVFISVPF